MVTRSTGDGDLAARPLDERAPRTHYIAERSKLNQMEHLSQFIVQLYGWSHFSARREASLL